MFQVNDDLSIYVTRGDMVFLRVTAMRNGSAYTFEAGEVIRIKVYGKKDAENVVLQKDFPVTATSAYVDIILTEEDTKIGEVISKHKDYWYEVELNPYDNPMTIIGYDEDGAKIFRLFPEGADIPEYVPDPEVIKVIDTELDMASERPVQNQVIARAFANLQAGYQAVHEAVSKVHVTPQMFGAVGDGVADDTKAFETMISAKPDVIHIPSGVYKVTQVDFSALTNCRVTCSGVFLNGNTNDVYGIIIAGGTDNTFDGFTIDGNASKFPNGTSQYGKVCSLLVNNNAERCIFSNTVIENALYCGVIFNAGVKNCKFYDTSFRNIGEHCFYIGAADNILFNGITVDTWGNNVLCVSDGHDCAIIKQANRASSEITVRDVKATSTGGVMAYGFNINDCDGFEIDGVTFDTDKCFITSGQSVTGFKVQRGKIECALSSSYFNSDAVFTSCDLVSIGTMSGNLVFNDCRFKINYAEINASSFVEFNHCRFDFVSNSMRLNRHAGITFNDCIIVSNATAAQGVYMFTNASSQTGVSNVVLNNCTIDSINYSGGFYGGKKINLTFKGCDLSKLNNNVGIVTLSMNDCVCSNTLAWSGWDSENAHGCNVRNAAGVSTTRIRKSVNITKGYDYAVITGLRYITFRKCTTEDIILMNATNNTFVWAELTEGTDNQALYLKVPAAVDSDTAVIVIIDLNE